MATASRFEVRSSVPRVEDSDPAVAGGARRGRARKRGNKGNKPRPPEPEGESRPSRGGQRREFGGQHHQVTGVLNASIDIPTETQSANTAAMRNEGSAGNSQSYQSGGNTSGAHTESTRREHHQSRPDRGRSSASRKSHDSRRGGGRRGPGMERESGRREAHGGAENLGEESSAECLNAGAKVFVPQAHTPQTNFSAPGQFHSSGRTGEQVSSDGLLTAGESRNSGHRDSGARGRHHSQRPPRNAPRSAPSSCRQDTRKRDGRSMDGNWRDEKPNLPTNGHQPPHTHRSTASNGRDEQKAACGSSAAEDNASRHSAPASVAPATGDEVKPEERSHRPPKRPAVQQVMTGSARADKIVEELLAGTCDCMVCCDTVRHFQKIWSCGLCSRIFHMNCIQKWGRSETARVQPSATAAEAALDPTAGWRCPSCQCVHKQIPTVYWCFCGQVNLGNKMQRRRRDYGVTPHSCGEICGKQREQSHCTHRCNLLCHPGPCPACPAMVRLTCGCGRTTQTVRCSQAGRSPACQSVCGRMLLCGRHSCTSLCHDGPCEPCERQLEQTCFCGRGKRTHPCANTPTSDLSSSPNGSFSCEEPCHRPLTCGNHLCESPCHPGACKTCELSPELVLTCYCGRERLAELAGKGVTEARRESCLDPIPSCGGTCNRVLLCGDVEAGNPHTCHVICHDGACRPCPAKSTRKCRCGHSTQKVPCQDLLAGKEVLCERPCNAKRSCGRHRCNQRCCADEGHICMLICGKKLQCTRHKCEELCHRGHCGQCWQTIFDELKCHCGAEVLLPPQPCGTQPPTCKRVCSRVHSCEHPPDHNCHSEQSCPPCPILVQKKCMCGRQVQKAVPCHIEDVSCGTRCSKPMACNRHGCDRLCHRGACLEKDKVCTQSCTTPRKDCKHPCAAPCHPGWPCPDTSCHASVVLHCPCGRRSREVTCAQALGKASASSFTSTDLARRMTSGSVTFNDKVKVTCDVQCENEKRIRQMAEALHVDSAPPVNCFVSPFLIDKIKSDSDVVVSIDKQIDALVKSVLKMPADSHKTLMLPIMNPDHRHIAHEVAEMYGCESQSFDSEPNRSVRITAYSHSYPPPITLGDLVRRTRSYGTAPSTSATASASSDTAMFLPASGFVTLQKKPPIDHFAD